jgi:uncharacterized lipoprotein NlpE involved in copper resistance
MKNFIAAMVMLILAFTLTACDNNSDNDTSLNALLQIDYAADEITSRYESFHEFVHVEEGVWIVIVTDNTVKNFEYIKVNHKFLEDKIVFF